MSFRRAIPRCSRRAVGVGRWSSINSYRFDSENCGRRRRRPALPPSDRHTTDVAAARQTASPPTDFRSSGHLSLSLGRMSMTSRRDVTAVLTSNGIMSSVSDRDTPRSRSETWPDRRPIDQSDCVRNSAISMSSPRF